MAALSSPLLRLFFLFSFVIVSVDGQCLDDQKKLLLDLRSEIVFNSSEAPYLLTWNETDDCCQWFNVECDAGGHVIYVYITTVFSGIGESSSLFRLTYLSSLDLSGNHLTKTPIPRSIRHLKNLRRLVLSDSGFVGSIPSKLGSLSELVYLDLSDNFLTGSIPSTLANLTKLVQLGLADNKLTGSIPSSLSNLTRLVHLYLQGNSLTGSIPSLYSCNNLEQVDLSDNNLMGSLSHLRFEALTNLSYLDLSHNSLNGTIPHNLFTLPSIDRLYLLDNQFSGQINDFEVGNLSNLVWLDLRSNRIEGPIPNSFFQFPLLSYLWLSDNMFDGTFELHNNQSLPWLTDLRLSSCNLYDFPDLRNRSSLSTLDLSNNRIGGDIPSWIWDIGISSLNLSLNLLTDFQKPYYMLPSLLELDLHSNQLRCEFPLLPQGIPESTRGYAAPTFFYLSNNSLTGVIPSSICIASQNILLFDLSFNNLSGTIPPCLLEKSSMLQVLNLRGNNIDGVIPDKFSRHCDLKTFDVSDNNLGWKIPKSLANCKDLVVMNVGNNNFDDSFPCLLPLTLHILILRSNKFHGDLSCHKSWPNLQILDISSNNFSGTLNPLNLLTWKGMMLQNPAHIRPNRSSSKFLGTGDSYRDEVTLTVKGIEVKLVKIWPDFTSIDLSCNNFEGEIPSAIGNLTSLYLLNLSHNALTGTIPKSFGALTELGSLDLSANHLTGRIPEQLAHLTFLAVLNVSHNHLTGKIPTGPQFQTFQADAFEGNIGLCGFPLNKSCSSPPQGSGATPLKSEDEEIEWEYVFAALGYVVGLGIIAWTVLCRKSFRERYFEKIEDVVDNIFYERRRRRRHERRVETRNVVIRRRYQSVKSPF